jgi:hypothetical protein
MQVALACAAAQPNAQQVAPCQISTRVALVCAPEVALASMDSRSPRTRSRIGASAQHQRAQKSHWCLGTTPTRTEVALVFLAHHQRAPQSHFIHLLCIIYSLYLAHHHFLLHFFLAFAFTLLRHHFSFISFLLLLCSAIIFFFIFFLLLLLLCFASPSFFSSFLSFLLCFALLRHHFFLFIFFLAFAFALLCFTFIFFFIFFLLLLLLDSPLACLPLFSTFSPHWPQGSGM